MASRKQIMAALAAKLATTYPFTTVTRRVRDTIATIPTPALVVVKHSEVYSSPATNQPAVRRMMALAIVYIDVGSDENAIPQDTVDDIQDAFDKALAPDNPQTGKCTLGGLVQSVVIDGRVQSAPGDLTGKGLAVVPLNILIP